PTWGAAGAAWGFLAAEGALLLAAARACAAVGFAVPLASPLAWGAALALPCTAAAALGGAGLVVPGTAAAIVYALLAMGVMAHARGLERKEAMGIRWARPCRSAWRPPFPGREPRAGPRPSIARSCAPSSTR